MSVNRIEESDELYLKLLNKLDTGEDDFNIEIPLIEFAEDLGRLFFSELKNTKIDDMFRNSNARLYYKSITDNMMHYEVSRIDRIKLGIFLTNILLRNILYEEEIVPMNQEKRKLRVLKIIQKKVDAVKYQNYILIDKDFVSKYYVIYFIFNYFSMTSKGIYL
jgi:hypothetical protein